MAGEKDGKRGMEGEKDGKSRRTRGVDRHSKREKEEGVLLMQTPSTNRLQGRGWQRGGSMLACSVASVSSHTYTYAHIHTVKKKLG